MTDGKSPCGSAFCQAKDWECKAVNCPNYPDFQPAVLEAVAAPDYLPVLTRIALALEVLSGDRKRALIDIRANIQTLMAEQMERAGTNPLTGEEKFAAAQASQYAKELLAMETAHPWLKDT